MAEEMKRCVTCGHLFVPFRSYQKYCSRGCRPSTNGYKTRARKRTGKNMSLQEMNEEARKAGLSYGKYRATLSGAHYERSF